MSDRYLYFNNSVQFLNGYSIGGYVKRIFLPIGNYFQENPQYYTCNILFFCFLICWYVHSIYFSVLIYVAGTSFNFQTLVSTQPINLVEEVSQNKSVAQTPMTYFIDQKEKHVSIWHNSIVTLTKSWGPFCCINTMCIIYFDVKFF